ncbi:MAG: HlyD family efflux transporter periplasmic adaptor subunit, partial [Myxococcales bacterium]|nr:HlyD family efflux transporter periplasmic adaptor subunit [Myxococcales bacterium]
GTAPAGSLWRAKRNGSAELAAVHPPDEAGAPEAHRVAVEAALHAGRPVVHSAESRHLLTAVTRAKPATWVAVVEQGAVPPRQQATALEGVSSALRWLVWAIENGLGRERPSAGAELGSEQLLSLLAVALEPQPPTQTALAVTTELASILGAERVSLGRSEGGEVTLRAVSHTANPDPRSALVRSVVTAMQEALDQDAVVNWPAATESGLALGGHRALSGSHGSAVIWTIPLRHGEDLIGALTAEFTTEGNASDSKHAWFRRLTSLLAPALDLRERDGENFWRRCKRLVGEDLPEALGWERVQRRFAFIGIACALVLLGVIPGTHRIAAPAELEGIVQRAIVSPMPAFVAESRRRAGDLVKRGEVLGLLEDAELLLERRKWAAKREQRQKELRAAMASEDRPRVRILRAQIDQADAELELVAEQLRKTRLLAPFDGVVTQGDLSQSLGSPVERGEVLFEVAPLDDYRVVVEVADRDIALVEIGQLGELTLQSLPGEQRGFRVRRITPISSAEEGRNFFRVEATLFEATAELRPGMDGIAKIEVGRRSLFWLMTHSVIEWIQLRWWAWVP